VRRRSPRHAHAPARMSPHPNCAGARMPRPSDRKLHRGSRVMAQAPEPAILTRRSVFVTTGVTGTSAAQQDNENFTLNSSSQLHQVTAAALARGRRPRPSDAPMLRQGLERRFFGPLLALVRPGAAGLRTRQGRAARMGGQALIRSRLFSRQAWGRGRPANRSQASTGCGSRLLGQAAPGVRGR
jgi:hypothetical protein